MSDGPRLVFADVPREGGAVVLGDKRRGCRHCGHVAVTVSADERVRWYHPGTSCCAGAVRDQLRWRQDELQGLRNEWRRANAEVNELDTAAVEAPPAERKRLEADAARKRRGLQVRVDEVWRPHAAELEAEVHALQAQLARF